MNRNRHFSFTLPCSPLQQQARIAFVLLIWGLAIVAGAKTAHAERLSSYLLRQNLSPNAYLLAAHWQTPDAKLKQDAVHRSLLSGFSNVPSESQMENLDPGSRNRWFEWLASIQPKGRIRMPSADARWLEANPRFDPRLSEGHRVEIPNRPQTVTVVKNSGGICQLPHHAGRAASNYARACEPNQPYTFSWGFIVQPDGAVEKIGVGLWNQTAQTSPAPGAWIWLPAEEFNWPDDFHDRLTDFLAGQGAAADLVQAQQPASSDQSVAASFFTPSRAADYQDHAVSASDWGGIGLLQTPTARFAPAGNGSVSISTTSPYTRLNVMLTPFDWLEAGFRYVDVSNRLYGPEIAGSQSYKDKSIDAKFRLWPESQYAPQVAIGFRDLGGTGLFAGEYLVASKRFGAIDASLGMGWGYVGGRGNISNPLGIFSSKLKTRPTRTASAISGGEFNLNTYFRGPTALFGGLQYQTPWQGLTFKLEIDGNNYQNEPQDNNQKTSSPLNLGAVYQINKNTALTLGLERGNQIMFGFSLNANLGQLRTQKSDDPKMLPVMPQRGQHTLTKARPEDWQSLAEALKQQTRWNIQQITRRDRALRVEISHAPVFDWPYAIDQASAVMHAKAPAEIATFTYVLYEQGLPITELTINRDDWARDQTEFVPQPIRLHQPRVHDPLLLTSPVRPAATDEVLLNEKPQRLVTQLSMNYNQSLGGPDAFILYQLDAQASAELRLTPNAWITAVGRLRLLDNYDRFKYTGPSNLPRVRTLIREFVTSSDITLPVLQATQTFDLSDDWSASLYGGLLEAMYAGVGGELLLRPFHSNWALGFDINRVRQRGFKQNFSMGKGEGDIEATTGHATLYWQTGWESVLAKISAGQYLAGDRGITVDLSRGFPNGVKIGAFATKTNVSATDFGEGAFDKGIYVTIPFDAIMTRSSNLNANIVWRPLTRDGGAKLDRQFELYDLTRLKGPLD